MTELVRYDAMRSAVQVASTVDEARDIADKATALKAYARQHCDPEMFRWLAEIQLRAKRRIGELSAGLDASKGGNNPAATLPEGGKSKTAALAAAESTPLRWSPFRCRVRSTAFHASMAISSSTSPASWRSTFTAACLQCDRAALLRTSQNHLP